MHKFNVTRAVRAGALTLHTVPYLIAAGRPLPRLPLPQQQPRLQLLLGAHSLPLAMQMLRNLVAKIET